MSHEATWQRLFKHRIIVDGHWLWTGAIRARGANGKGEPYGGVRYQGKVWLVHRLAFFLANGRMPEGHIDHGRCPTLCFNPDHLRDVTPAVNAAGRDRAAVLAALDRGRQTRWASPRGGDISQ